MKLTNFGSKIGVLDTSISSLNIGDYIIMSAARNVLAELFPNQQKVTFSTHDSFGRTALKRQKCVDINFLCGTNCLNSFMFLHRQWNVGLFSPLFMAKTIPLGVGWGRYERGPDSYTRWLLGKLISKDFICSVRDSYTHEYLRQAGINNSIVTGCPTMWGLTKSHCQSIPKDKADRVIFTLTDYCPDIANDRRFLEILNQEYERLYFWPQGSMDLDYLSSLNVDISNKLELIPPSLEAFDTYLSQMSPIDYVGTRLHAGIRAIQLKRRAIIIGIDNRAIEKKADFNLKVISRDDVIHELADQLRNKFTTKIVIPQDNINCWKEQFL